MNKSITLSREEIKNLYKIMDKNTSPTFEICQENDNGIGPSTFVKISSYQYDGLSVYTVIDITDHYKW